MDRLFHIRPLVAATVLASCAIFVCLQVSDQRDAIAQGPGDGVAAEAAPVLEPTARDRRIARMISMLMPRYHVSTTDLNDTISQRERSMLTLALLAATGNFEEIPMHIRATANTGASKEDVMQALMHVAIYAGVPKANHAIKLAKTTYAEMEGTT